MFDAKGRRKYLSASEHKAFYQSIQNEPDVWKKTFCLTLLHTGCRISEALNLTFEQVDFTKAKVVFKTLKQREKLKYRGEFIPTYLLEMLKRLNERDMRCKRIWRFSRTTGYRIIKSHMRQAGIIGGMAMPKGLRHGHAVAGVTVNVPIMVVSEMLGHENIENTMIYLSFMDDEKRKWAEKIWETYL